MAAAIIVANREVQDLLVSVDEDIEHRPVAFSKALSILRPALNNVAKAACRAPDELNDEIERQRRRVAVSRTTSRAFQLFLSNMDIGD